MLVEATQDGYYEHKRRKPGEQFYLVQRDGKKDPKTGKTPIMTTEEQFSGVWMKKVRDGGAPAKKAPIKGPSGRSENPDEVEE